MVNLLSGELKSPIVNKDRSVTFNLRSENAKMVEISADLKFETPSTGQTGIGGLGNLIPLKKTVSNVWTITSVPMLPGDSYTYSFIVDGLYVLDPLNPLIRRIAPTHGNDVKVNVVRIDAEEAMPWNLFSDIPHGKVVIERLHSETLKHVKPCAIYLPPGYKSTVRYPILYLLHGAGSDYGSWYYHGETDNIMDYLIAKGRAKEMIVAMPDGNVTSSEATTGAVRAVVRPMMTASPEERRMRDERHLDYFVRDVMPFVESRYRISKDSRAIAGLSMGGGQTLNIIAGYPEMFMAAGTFSGASSDDVLTRLPSVKDQLKRYRPMYVSCGNWDSLLERSRMLSKKLDELGISHVYFSADLGHVMPFWQRSLIDFVSRLSETL